MKAIQKLDRAFDKMLTVLAVLAGVLVAFMMLSVSADVALRYFFAKPLLWVHEISEIALLYMTFLASAWVLKREGHVAVDLLFAWLSRRTALYLHTATSSISAVVCLIVACYGVPVTWDYYVQGSYKLSLLELPTALFLAIVPVGCFLLFIQFLRRTAGFVHKLQSSKT